MYNNKFYPMDFIFKKEKGFTMIELIISIFILSVAIVGIFSAFIMVTILTSNTADRLTATYLAQEGMEIVRNIRDSNWLNMDTCLGTTCDYKWDDGFSSCLSGCKMDYTTTSYFVAPSSSGDYLYIDTDGFYSYKSGGTKTKFQRKITITPVTDVDGKSDHIIKVAVQTSWDEKANIFNHQGKPADTCGSSNCVITDETLYNWYNYTSQ
jgi:prepilin-type N-terminal cleavage/methylation domain-containing protein